ncbi:MAG: Flp pilus assembly protein CpaB [Hyphomicrobiales bacterium]
MQVKRVMVLGLALGAAVVAGVLAKNILTEKTVEIVQTPSEETIRILVAAKDIPLGNQLTEKGIQWQTWPKKAVSSKYITKAKVPDGLSKYARALARTGIIAGEPILERKLISPETGGFMAAILPKGMRAVSFKISADTGAGGFILPNDRVDIILTRKVRMKKGSEEAHVSETVLKNVRVLAINQTFRENEKGDQVIVGKTATVELRPQQTEILEVADSMGALSLSLRSIAETSGKLGDAGPKSAENFSSGRGGGGVAVIRYGSTSIIHGNQ